MNIVSTYKASFNLLAGESYVKLKVTVKSAEYLIRCINEMKNQGLLYYMSIAIGIYNRYSSPRELSNTL